MKLHWIADMESTFHAIFCLMETKVRFATCIMRDRARDWWFEVVQNLQQGAIESMTWEYFVTIFKREFVLAIEVQQLAQEYLVLEQTSRMVAEITAKFRERALFFPWYVVT